MNNNNDNNNKDKKPIKIDLNNLEDMSEEEILNLINEITTNELGEQKQVSFWTKAKKILLEFLFKFVIDFVLIFTINFFIKVVETNILNFIIYFSIFNFIDYVFNKYFSKRFPLIKMISFGFINYIITFLSFVVSGIICIQFLDIVFVKFFKYFLAITIFVLIKKFVLKYLNKLRKRGIENVSNK